MNGRLIALSVGDGLCCGLEEANGYSTQLDWGYGRSPRMAVDAFERFGHKHRLGLWEVPGHGFPKSRFPNSFVLSHLHADHYNGLMAASLERRYQSSWVGLRRVLFPGMPDLPGGLREGFFLALFTLGAVTVGTQTGHPDYDFLGAVSRLSHAGVFRHRRLFRGDTFALGGSRNECLWPPRTVADEALGGQVRNALRSFYQELETRPILRDLHTRISEHPTFAALAREPEEGGTVHLEPLLESPYGTEDDAGALADLAREMEDTNERLRKVANDLSLAFSRGDRLLFLGDLEERQLASVVAQLKREGRTRFEVVIAAHHGSHWHDALSCLRAGTVLVPRGSGMRRHYKPGYGDIADDVRYTDEEDDLTVWF